MKVLAAKGSTVANDFLQEAKSGEAFVVPNGP